MTRHIVWQAALAFLGIFLEQMTDRRAEEEGIATGSGIYIQNVVEGAAAEGAGVQGGDVLVRLGGYEITSLEDLFAAMPGIRVHGGEFIQYALRMGAETFHALKKILKGEGLNTAATGYAFVYHLEIGLLFATLAVLGPLVRLAQPSTQPTQSGPARIGLADFPT